LFLDVAFMDAVGASVFDRLTTGAILNTRRLIRNRLDHSSLVQVQEGGSPTNHQHYGDDKRSELTRRHL